MNDATDLRLEIETSPGTWRNIITTTTDIKVKRAEWEVGTLSATVRDATVDPAVAADIRPGKPVRVSAYDVNTWRNIFTGVLNKAETKYGKDGKATVTLSGVDAMSVLAGSPAAFAPALIPQLPLVIDDLGIPYNVNGQTTKTQATTNYGSGPWSRAVARYEAERLSALDAISLTRDTNKGYAWVDKEGVVQIYDAASLPSHPFYTWYASDEPLEPEIDRINYQYNPRGLVSTSSWTATGASNSALAGGGRRFTSNAGFGSSSRIYVQMPTVLDIDQTVEAETAWNLTFDLRQISGPAVGVAIQWRRAGSSTWLSTGVNWTNATTSWVRRNYTIGIAPGNLEWRLDVIGYSTGQVVFEVDNVMAQKDKGMSLNYSYFDGTSPGAYWEGTAYESRSISDPVGSYNFSYSDIDVGFDTSAVINVVNVKAVETVDTIENVSFTTGTGELVEFSKVVPKEQSADHQFYNQASIDEWGARAYPVTLLAPLVASYTEDSNGDPTNITYTYDVEDWADDLMTARSAPVINARSIRFPVKDGGSRRAASWLDFFHKVNVRYKELVDTPDMRITGIDHDIRPGRWIVTMSFDAKIDNTPW